MKVIGVIPARMDSQRFPGKPLYQILDRPMISHVYDRAKLCNLLDSLFLSSCDIEIADFAKKILNSIKNYKKDFPISLEKAKQIEQKLK